MRGAAKRVWVGFAVCWVAGMRLLIRVVRLGVLLISVLWFG